MSFLKVLQDSGIIQMLRNSLRTEREKAEFDELLENKVQEYARLYEDMNAQVMQYKSDVERINVKQSEHNEREDQDDS
ncbi:MAG: hypothetical protein VXZ51_04845 [Actinomycetota bacterium]|nr:hypothetical protein [Actinomycetota bacterium]